ncbi:hypothetical protein Hanom_Chr10g00956171 [Helianthus anomalus]
MTILTTFSQLLIKGFGMKNITRVGMKLVSYLYNYIEVFSFVIDRFFFDFRFCIRVILHQIRYEKVNYTKPVQRQLLKLLEMVMLHTQMRLR